MSQSYGHSKNKGSSPKELEPFKQLTVDLYIQSLKILISHRPTQTCADNEDLLPGRLAQATGSAAFQAETSLSRISGSDCFCLRKSRRQNIRVRLCVSSERSERAANK